jgi:selenocysteine-specific elongation factor
MKKTPPGLLRPRENPDVIMMICTAGHVDHGKTRLVGLLTGCATDRLREEQERGLTIELGFAPCTLGGDRCVGIVDVPGHEKFIRNMVAGVSGIAMTVLVIAADDGVMPQTIEHVQIMELMGVRHGIVALTKTDLVDEALLNRRIQEVERFLGNTFLAGSRICPLSSETGEGVFEFYEALVTEIRDRRQITRGGIFRMPVERTFTQKGFGVVATGIPVSGAIRTGDTVEAVPGGAKGRIRGMQRFLRDADAGGAGQCLALNISDFSTDAIQRGTVLCRPGYVQACRCLHVRLKTVAGLHPPLRHTENMRIHAGTSEKGATLYLLENKVLEGGHEGLATLVTTEAVAVAPGGRIILRRPSPAVTVAGGEILEASPEAKRPRKKDLLPRLREHITWSEEGAAAGIGEGELRLSWALYAGEDDAPDTAALSRAALLPEEEAAAVMEKLIEKGDAIAVAEGHYIHARRFAKWLETLEKHLEEMRQEGKTSINAKKLAQEYNCPAVLWQALTGELEKCGVARLRGGKLLPGNRGAELPPEEQRLREKMIRLYEARGFASPRPDELPDLLKAPPKSVEKMLNTLCDEGVLFRLGKNVVLCYTVLADAQDRVIRVIQEAGRLDSADFKNHIASSRKYALAILDFFDRQGVTVRRENIRKLASRYEERLL